MLSDNFGPGAFIDEAGICEMTGASRSPIRKTLNRLTADSYFELPPPRGGLVKRSSADELHDPFEVRQSTESHVLRRFCRDRLESPVERSRLCGRHEAISAEDLLTCVEINRLLHQAFAAITDNIVPVQAFDNL